MILYNRYKREPVTAALFFLNLKPVTLQSGYKKFFFKTGRQN